MDVTEPTQITRAVSEVAEVVGDQGLDVLVNNAGIGVFLPMEITPMDKFRRQLDVNVSGLLEVTQRFLPLIREAAGHIVLVGSLADRITMPFAGSQAAAKHAVLATAEALRQELAPWSIPVVLVEPASIRSAAIDKLRGDTDRAVREFSGRDRDLYGSTLVRMVSHAMDRVAHGSPPDEVATAISRAVRTPRPKARYLCGEHAIVLAVLAKLPPRLLDAIRRRLFALPKPGELREARPEQSGIRHA